MPETGLNVKLFRYTPAPEETIALAGRLCYSDAEIEELADEISSGAEAFVRKLMDLGHHSPIEHVSFTFGIEGVSRALLAQITRHRIASFSVQSQRYVAQEDFNFIVPPSIRELGDEAVAKYCDQMRVIAGYYNEWREAGALAEDARFVLPNACETRMLLTMNARELIHFFKLRCCNRAQWEIRNLAWAMLGIALREAPAIFKETGPGCVGGACTEGKMSCKKAGDMRERFDALREFVSGLPEDGEIVRFVLERLSEYAKQ